MSEEEQYVEGVVNEFSVELLKDFMIGALSERAEESAESFERVKRDLTVFLFIDKTHKLLDESAND